MPHKTGSSDDAMSIVMERPKDSIDRFRLKKLLEELEKKTGRGTELISLYIPPGRPISDVVSALRQEHSTAANIKSKQTRKNVMDALESIMARLKYLRKTPENGLVVFCGAIPRSGPGTEKIEFYMIEPPEPVPFYLYRCNSKFYLEPLKDMIREKEAYGLIVIDREQAAIGLLKGKRAEIVEVLTSGIPGKHDQGGQSQRRFARIIEQLAHEFYTRVGEHASKAFLPLGDNLKGVVIGGPGPTKEQFAQGNYLDYRLKKKVLGVVDVGYSGEEGIYELIQRAMDLISESRYAQERQLVQKFMYYLAKNPQMITYGLKDTLKALEAGAAAIVMVSEATDLVKVRGKCKLCGKPYEGIVEEKKLYHDPPKCEACGGPIEYIERKHIVDVISEIASRHGTRVEMVSTATPEGEQLNKVFGGIAAILRFPLQF